MRYYDLTVPVRAEMAQWPGDPTVRIERAHALAAGEGANVSALRLSTHTGTHVDAPLHLLSAGASVDALPLRALIGPVEVAHLSGAEPITAARLEALALPGDCRRLLLRTGNSDRGLPAMPGFCEDYVALSQDAGAWLAARGLWLVGIDALSVDPYNSETLPAHHALLERGVVIVEGLDLRDVPSGRYDLLCLPLKLQGGDGAPARVILGERRSEC